MSTEVNYSDVQGLVRFGYGQAQRGQIRPREYQERRGRAVLVAVCAGHQRPEHEPAAIHRVASRFHSGGPSSAWRRGI